jgi:hypothetical protein
MVASVGSIAVTLDADLSRFSTSLSHGSAQVARHAGRMRRDVAQVDAATLSLSQRMKGMGRSIATAMRGVSIAAIGATTVLGVALKGQINQLDELSKASQAIGVPVEELSRLKYAADLSGVSFEKLTSSVGKLGKSMSDALRSATSEQAQAFRVLGISITNSDGSLRDVRAVLGEIAERFSRFRDGAGKSALAMALLGRSGRDLIPLLNAGSMGIREMGDEAERLGKVVDAKTAKAAERFNDNLTRVRAVVTGLGTQLAAKLLPAMEKLSEMLVQASQNSGTMQLALDAVVWIFKSLVQAGVEAVAIFKEIDTWTRAIGESFRFAVSGEFGKAVERLKAGAAEVDDIWENTAKRVAEIWDAQSAPLNAGTVRPPSLAAPTLATGKSGGSRRTKGRDPYADILARAQERIAQLRIEEQSLTMTANAADQLRFRHDLLNDAQRAGIELSSSQKRELDSLAAQYGVLGARIDDARKEQERLKAVVGELDRFGTDALQSLIDGTFSWKDAIRQLIPLVQRLLTSSSQSGFFGPLLGNLFGVTQFHDGGVVGEGGTPRLASPAAFRDAPRFHTGLQSNEMAAILEKGEAVLTKRHQAIVGRAMDTLGSGGGDNYYQIDARGSTMTPDQFRRILDENNRKQNAQFPARFAKARSRGGI